MESVSGCRLRKTQLAAAGIKDGSNHEPKKLEKLKTWVIFWSLWKGI